MILALLCFLSLAAAIITNKVLLAYLPIVSFVGVRTLSAGCIMLFARRGWRHLLHEIKHPQVLFVLIMIALFTTSIPSLCKAYAFKYLPASKAGFIGSLDPFFTALYAYILYATKLSLRQWVAILLSFVGALVLCFSQSPGDISLHAFLFFSWPELAAFASVALSRYGWMLAQQLLKKEAHHPAQLNAYLMVISGLLMLPLGLLTEPAYAAFAQLGLMQWALLAFTIIVGNVVGYTMYNFLLRRHTPHFVSLGGFTIPIFITIMGMIFFGESLSQSFILGAALILAGGFLFRK